MSDSDLDEIRFSGGDGLSSENAVIIQGARHTVAGVLAEHRWLRERYPGSEVGGQTLVERDGRMMDVLEVRTAEGEMIEIFFDIQEFFGEF